VKPTGVYLMTGTAAATAATGLGALLFGLICNESLNETGLEGAVCDIADGVAVASVVLGVAAPLTVGWWSRHGHASPQAFTASWVALVGWGALLVVAAFIVG
jgi:hypothetical protein